jgi:NitT/TauT family transport system permease protein
MTGRERTQQGRPQASWLASQAGRRVRGVRDIALDLLLPVLAVAAGLTAYHIWVVATDQPAWRFPTPPDVWAELREEPRFFARQAWVTGYEAVAGLLLATAIAVTLGALMAYSSFLERTILPLAVLVKVTPVVAIAPAFIIWWGFGPWPKIAVAALITFFPILINSVTGFRSVRPEIWALLEIYRMPWWKRFWYARLPAALPYLLSAIKVSATLAIIGAVVAEWFGADQGLGRVIYLANTDIQPARLFAAVSVLAAMGITFTVAIGLLERRLLFWHDSQLFESGGKNR